jgi:hypothetical protein
MWVLTMADLLGGRVAPLARWIRTGLLVGQPINQEVVAHHLLEAYGDGQTSYAAYKKLVSLSLSLSGLSLWSLSLSLSVNLLLLCADRMNHIQVGLGGGLVWE